MDSKCKNTFAFTHQGDHRHRKMAGVDQEVGLRELYPLTFPVYLPFSMNPSGLYSLPAKSCAGGLQSTSRCDYGISNIHQV